MLRAGNVVAGKRLIGHFKCDLGTIFAAPGKIVPFVYFLQFEQTQQQQTRLIDDTSLNSERHIREHCPRYEAQYRMKDECVTV